MRFLQAPWIIEEEIYWLLLEIFLVMEAFSASDT